jgi:protein-disulfide isomerase
VVTFYEDFLCPACGNFERGFGPTFSKLIDDGAIAADYNMTGLLSRAQNEQYSSRAGNAAYCVADESIDAFRRFHTALYTKDIQPSETGTSFPDNAKLTELAREAGAVGKVPDCIKSGKYIPMVDGLAAAAGIHATPTVRINGQDYQWTTPKDLVVKIKEIVGDIPGIDSAATPATP